MRRLVQITLVLALSATSAFAQQGPQARFGTQKGESLLSFASQITRTEDTSIVTSAGYGIFLTEEHEVGGQLTFFDTEDFSLQILAAYYNYNYKFSARTWGYAGPHLGVSRVDAPGFDDTGLSIGAHVGGRQWVSPAASVFAEQRYTTISGDSDDEISLLVGLNITF